MKIWTLLLFVNMITDLHSNENPYRVNSRDESLIEQTIPHSASDSIHKLYRNIDPNETITFAAFKHAYQGYLKLREKGSQTKSDILAVIDFTKSSVEPRLFIMDLSKNELLYQTFVAHGTNSGLKSAVKFSNIEGSHQSSLGFYLTGETYFGKHGYSLKLFGLEEGFNDKAEERSIVIHGANYATLNFIKKYGRLGRSWGCPSVPPHMSKEIIDIIKQGSLLFIYSENQDYLTNSKIIN